MATIKKAVKKAIAKKVMSKRPMMQAPPSASSPMGGGPMMKHGGTLSPSKKAVSKNIGNLNKAQDGETIPDYRNMSKVRKVTTAKDSADYKSGFQKASSGKAANFPNKAGKYGQNEAARRGLVPKKAKVGAKMKMGGKCKNGC
jgi:hypothetical protein